MSNKTEQYVDNSGSLAIVGIGCMFPKANSKDAYWSNIKEGVDAITNVPAGHWKADDYFNADPNAPDMTYVQRGGFIEPVEFDPLFYGISPNNIEATDTTQLLGMVAAREALLDAGYATGSDTDDGRPFDRDRTSVILGVTGTLELVIPLGARLGHPLWRQALQDAGVADDVTEEVVQRIAAGYVPWQENSFPGLLGNVAAGRIANRFDLGGTNCVVDAACASSLGAIHLAAMELNTGRCDMAISGGLDTFNDIFMYMCFSKTPALSPTGNSRPFHIDGDGTILGEGLGVVILKRLADAQRDNDRIYAVIKGIGSASDGKGNAVYAPSPEGQKKALLNAYQQADLLPRTIELVEAHGTGTRVGDAVEAKALSEVFRDDLDQQTWCAIGSVKSMIGHTKAAAGVAGLIKIALALQHKVLPPTIKVDQPLETLEPGQAPVYINTEKRPWVKTPDHPRRAAVSAFGFGGSNFHAVLEENESGKAAIEWDGMVLLYALSADNKDDIKNKLTSFDPGQQWQDLRRAAAESLQAFDPQKDCRLILVLDRNQTDPGKLIDNATAMLAIADSSWSTPDGAYFGSGRAAGKLGMLFPGQGSQYTGMLRDLACQFPQLLSVLSAANDEFGEIEYGKRLSDHIYPISVFTAKARADNETALRSTAITQPAIGAISLGALRIVEHFGVRAEACAGHSFGELTALCCANSISESGLFALAQKRGALMNIKGGDHGTMLAVLASAADLYTLIEEQQLDLIIANHNAPAQVVLSGATDQIEKAENLLKGKKIRTKHLPVAAAFHSSFIAAAEKPFAEFLHTIEFRQPDIPVFANTTTETYPFDTNKARQLLAGQLAQPVEFVKEIENMYEHGVRTFIETGPGNTLTGLVTSILKGKKHEAIALDASRGKQSGQYDLACLLARLTTTGHGCNLELWDEGRLGKSRDEKKPAMTVTLSGANYVMPRGKSDPVTTRTRPEAAPSTPEIPQQTPVAIDADTPRLDDALRVNQQSILALQKMQEQTAHLHRQYLQGQEQAQSTIRQLVEQQQQMLTGVPFTPMPAAPPVTTTPALTADTSMATASIQTYPAATPTAVPQTTDIDQYRNIVLEVVAEKTGYPMDMLSLDMSLDTDLGIDSIKRVEILSALQEKVPGMLQIQAEELGTFQLLQHIVEFLASGTPTATTQPAEAAITDTGSATFQNTLLEIVADKTGYPVQMLDLDMNLDSDLGIDSIKRVEILSALQERLPDVPVVQPEDLGNLQTLQQIVAFMGADAAIETPAAGAVPVDDMVFQQALLDVVADKTGYPAEMLDLDMNLDSDLGIDSIKRVEILSALQERLPDALPVAAGELGALQTLQQIVNHMQGSRALVDVPVTTAGPEPAAVQGVTIYRSVVEVTPLTAAARDQISLPDNALVWITDDGTGLPEKICQALGKKQLNARVVPVDTSTDDNVAALIIVAPVTADTAFIQHAFKLIQQAGKQTLLLAGITRLGGTFAITGELTADPAAGGLPGLIKTADKEWPDTHCKAIDIPANSSNAKLVAAIVEELLFAGPLEAGITDRERCTLALNTSPVSHAEQTSRPLAAGDVVVISGGARGVTAEVAVTMANTFHCNMLLLGRSPLPAAEPEWWHGITTETAIKKAIIGRNTGAKLSPREVDAEYKNIIARREILINIKRIQDAGVEASYHSVDVRNVDAVTEAINQARTNLGPVRGIIHGAGVLADRLIVDKTLDQFAQVYTTKVGGLNSLLKATEKDDLKVIVLFSSSSARFGRQGQADYAAANEVLNKVAQHQQRQRPDCRVVSVNWGPWDGGMVTPQLKQIFASEGVGVIPLQAGADYLMQEIATDGPVEVMVLGSDPGQVTSLADSNAADSMQVAFRLNLDIDQYPILKSHVLNGNAVLPVALMAEWLAYGAMHNIPGLTFLGFDDLRILKGVILAPGESADLQIMAGQSLLRGSEEIVPVELRSDNAVHARARIVLGNDYAQGQSSGVSITSHTCPFKDKEYYGNDRLFHGHDLQGIENISACTAEGIVATAKPAPPPSQWMLQPIRSSWLTDPLVLDSSFQMLILWSFHNSGTGALPTAIGSYRQFQRSFPLDGIKIVARIDKNTEHSATAIIEFIDNDGKLVAVMNDYECVRDASLNGAFNLNQLGTYAGT